MDNTIHTAESTSHAYAQDETSSSTDDRPQARQKRKRTSPDDQATLEAAYKRNPKPDKAARLQLVELVALGEKEVQIWFQNRRQSCRRKSGRPLLPHEIAQYQMAKSTSCHEIEALGTFQPSDPDMPSSSEKFDGNQESPQSITVGEEQQNVEDTGIFMAEQSPGVLPLSSHPPAQSPNLSRAAPTSSSLLKLVPKQIGYFANRRSAPSLLRSYSETAMLPPAKSVGNEHAHKSSRAIRLSMDSEGNAIVTTKDTSSPSPPRPSRFVLLPETFSLPESPHSTTHGVTKRSYNGRSRDSRSWEFWCDKDARSELGDVAEKDSHGSAAGAIGLLRTASGRSVLGPLSSKRNAPIDQQESSAKRSKVRHKRTSIQRSSTSSGRLQGRPSQAQMPTKLKRSGTMSRTFRGSGDSDKENWSPSHDIGYESPSEDPSEGGASTLRKSRPGQTSRSSALNNRARVLRGGGDDPEADPELSAFMAGGRKSTAATGDADLDCVEGLLRLSQGNWTS